MEETEILRFAQPALRFMFVVGADGGAFAQPASRSLPFVLTNPIASPRNAGVLPTAMTAELVLVRRPRSDRGRRRRDGRNFQTNLLLRHGRHKLPNNVCFVAPFVALVVCSLGTLSGAVQIWRASLVKTFGTQALLFNKVSHLPLMPVNVLALRAGQPL